MTNRITHPNADIRSTLTVRAAAGQLRIVPVWQALGPHAAHAKQGGIRCDVKRNVDELRVTFESVSVDDLTEIAERLNAQSWVVAASLKAGTT
ncbi:hypothetical protein FAZ95_14770 [Trinickia violacea]|uniref:Uncharacterized protein n=1 Tax=Trinickia violacea TaxID=2571746 RepID=A0A4P8ITE5_9BURK|nr:hypothetical protein [Trinickia violacea]QCP50324.1 hypothetical protein FAZ95_14770 [Trinickia violacea]